MSVWLAIPSKRPQEEAEPVLRAWRERGYKIAVVRDLEDSGAEDMVEQQSDLYFVAEEEFGRYPGYAQSVNFLCQEIPKYDAGAEWIVAAGDDTLPEAGSSAEEIARECTGYFHRRFDSGWNGGLHGDTFGVMQPTGDRWGEGQGGFANAPIDRVAGSPWIGREFARRMYGGTGPYWHEYRHQFVDEELQNVALKLGVFWQRPDLTQRHNHWGRPRDGEIMAPSSRMPAFLAEANSAEHWRKYKGIFEARRAAGFPGHEPI